MMSVSIAAAQGVVVKSMASTLGNILADSRGMTLYIFTKDSPNVSNCYDGCATAWPPLLVPSGQNATGENIGGTFSTTQRKDGTQQVTYNGQPLYYFQKDQQPGDVTGQNVGNVWFVVKAVPAGAAPASLPTTGANDMPLATLLILALGMLTVGGAIMRFKTRRVQ